MLQVICSAGHWWGGGWRGPELPEWQSHSSILELVPGLWMSLTWFQCGLNEMLSIAVSWLYEIRSKTTPDRSRRISHGPAQHLFTSLYISLQISSDLFIFWYLLVSCWFPVGSPRLRDFGRFVEIGKRDQYEGTQMELTPFLKGRDWENFEQHELQVKQR
jgi:hypothetical protein